MEVQCDCCQNPAVVHEMLVRNGVKTEVHLCAEHAREQGFILPTEHGPALVVGKLLGTQPGTTAQGTRTVRACPGCATTMSQVRDRGLAGCPRCYQTFEEELGAIVERAQGGAAVHVGRHPEQAEDLVDRAELRNRLARELREAVAREEYERAARLRDRLHALGVAEEDAS